jgi:nitrogen PTS system EIIA component
MDEAFIAAELQARTKPSIIRQMVDLAENTGLVFDPTDLLKSLEEREQLCSTALSDGIALLHPRNHEPYMFEDSFIALGKTARPLPFGAPDGNMTDIFFLICCQDDRIHLRTLARICVMSKRSNMLEEIRAACDARSIMNAVREAEEKIIKEMTAKG